VVGGIYSPQPAVGVAAVDGCTGQSGAPPDTVRCASHVTQPLGFESCRPLEALSSSGTGQSSAAPDRHCSLSGAPLTLSCTVVHCSNVRRRCSRLLRWIVVTPLVHRTVWWHTGQSGEL
jgi:hypothetical protein